MVAATGRRTEERPKPAPLPPEIAHLGDEELLVNELFLSIQGESTHAGRPCFFIRLTGCHLRCVWCDTAYAFFEGSRFTVEECAARAAASGARLVEVTGGEPLIQRGVYPLMTRLADRGHEVLLETSGALPIDRVDPRVRRIVDWKCPGSGMERHNDPSVLAHLRAGDELKLVIGGRADYDWARAWLLASRGSIPGGVPVHFSPVAGRLSPRELAEWILEDRLEVRLNLQVHKLIWDPAARGV
jgi:7-carboxy-7-deazaguanine synthase